MPQTRSRCFSERAIEAMRIDEVFEARMQSGADDGLELAEQLLLDLEVLEHRLDDDVAALEVLERLGDAEVRLGLGEIGVGQPALGHQALQHLEDARLRLGRPAGRRVDT